MDKVHTSDVRITIKVNQSKRIKKIFRFLIYAYLSAFCFEEIPRIIFIKIFKDQSVVHLWEVPGALVFVPLWYGVIFLLAYLLFRNKPIKYVVVFGVAFGLLAETFVFNKMSVPGFFMFSVLYGGMFYVPFKLIEEKQEPS